MKKLEVSPRFELGSLDSESRVLTITPWDLAIFCSQLSGPGVSKIMYSLFVELAIFPTINTHMTCFHWNFFILINKRNWWARPGFEPGTSRTLSENHTPRPTSQDTHWQGTLKSDATTRKYELQTKRNALFPAGIEPATSPVWRVRDNHYTKETLISLQTFPGFY